MDGISSITPSSYLSQYPLSSSTGQSTAAASTSAPGDSVSLSGDSGARTPNTYSPDAAFTTLLQSDTSLAQDYSAENQFVFDATVLANDDTLSSDQTNASSGRTQAGQSSDPAAVAQQVDLGALNFNSGVMSQLLGGFTDASTSVFMGASMSNLLSANGSAALAYLTPQSAAAAGVLNTTA